MRRDQRRDRPIARSIVKLSTRIFLGRARAHYHSWLPFLTVEGRDSSAPGRIVYRGKPVVDLLATKVLTSMCGDAIYIVGSGPSVAEQDLSGLPPRSATLLNGAIALIAEPIATPLAIVIEDERFVWRHFAMMRDKIAPDYICLFSLGVLRAICEIDRAWLAGRSIILIDDIRKPYGHKRQSDADLKALAHVQLSEDAGFSTAPDRGVFQGGSVVISALQFACSLPVKTIGLLGIDISNAASPRFYETKGAVAYSGVADAEARILAHVALARAVAAAHGMELHNHSPISALLGIGMSCVPLPSSQP